MPNINFKPRFKSELILKRIFFRFLKDSDLYPLYIHNVTNIKFDYEYWNLQPNISDGRTLIGAAFQWGKTKEGFEFWHKRHNLWLQYLKLCNLKDKK